MLVVPSSLGHGRFSNAGGRPRDGLHRARLPLSPEVLPDAALWDVVGTALVVAVLGLGWRSLTLVALVSVVIHTVLRVDCFATRVLTF